MVSRKAVKIVDLSDAPVESRMVPLLRKGVTRPYEPNVPIDEEAGFTLNVTGWSPNSVMLRISGGNGVVEDVAGMDPKTVNEKVARQRGIVEAVLLNTEPQGISKRGIIKAYGEADPINLGRHLGLFNQL
jgi:hypothetical protein